MRSHLFPVAALAAASISGVAIAQQNLHFTYLWHMEQPIYWPDRQVSGEDRYQRAWESIQRKDGGAANPGDNLRDIFGLADRVAAYQWRVRDSINAVRGSSPEFGVQVSYSGGLIENLFSLGNANQLGYSPGWFNSYREARGWTTTSGSAQTRCDIVLFSFHHALMPLLEESTMRKQIQLYKEVYPDAWGTGQPISKGFFPSEMAFSTRMIPVLQSEGVEWSVVSAEKISRACIDFPVVFGSGGINTDPPNKADQVNPGGNNWFRQTISRGCSPAEAYPFAFTPRRAQYVNPETGAVSSIIVVPASQSLGWYDGYAPLDTSLFGVLNQQNNPSRPMLALMAHDGDNAWGGGFSYYMENTPNVVNTARNAGYVPTSVQRYLADHPVPAGDVVHVEDGAWVNADGDFGAPQFINWNWPLLNASGQIDVENGWHVDARNWAVITAMQNRLDTAERIWTAGGGTVNNRKILYPDAGTNAVERGWHYFFGALNSGFMYYGTAQDHEVKQTIACNNAARVLDPYLNAQLSGNPALDQTGPTIWYPQRHPWNPGSTNFGPQYGYQQVVNNGDFYVWSFISDVSSVQSVTLKYRLDADGANPLGSTANEVYTPAGAAAGEVGAWQSLPMTRRVFPAANVYNDPTINFFATPQYIADQYWVKINGIRSQLVDYYIEAVDARGNVKRSGIQHVWVGDGTGGTPPGGGGSGPRVTLNPSTPVAGQPVTVSYQSIGGPLLNSGQVRIHYGINGWQNIPSPDPQMSASGTAGVWAYTFTVPTTANTLQMVFNNGAGTWDNNSGQDWSFTVTGGVQPFVMDGNIDSNVIPVATTTNGTLYAAVRGTQLYLAGPNAGGGRDSFLFLRNVPPGPGPLQTAHWGKAGQVAAWDSFVGAENDGSFVGWFDVPTGVTRGQARGSVLEATIDLQQRYGALPQTIAICFAQYNTADGSPLIPSRQIPASVDGNTTLNASEWLTIDICALTAAGCPFACNLADVTGIGGQGIPPDGQLTVDDIIEFVNAFSDATGCPGTAPCNLADVTAIGGQAQPPDGQLTVDDVIEFVNAFSDGCP